MSGAPTSEDFRAIGYTSAAQNHPLTDQEYAWVLRYTGYPPHLAPPALRYAPGEASHKSIRRWTEMDLQRSAA